MSENHSSFKVNGFVEVRVTSWQQLNGGRLVRFELEVKLDDSAQLRLILKGLQSLDGVVRPSVQERNRRSDGVIEVWLNFNLFGIDETHKIEQIDDYQASMMAGLSNLAASAASNNTKTTANSGKRKS